MKDQPNATTSPGPMFCRAWVVAAMPTAAQNPRWRHTTKSVEKIRNGHQMTRPQPRAMDEWATPHAKELSKTDVAGLRKRRNTESNPAMISVSTNGAKTTSMKKAIGPFIGNSGAGRLGAMAPEIAASAMLPTILSAQPLSMASQARCGSRMAAGKNLRKLSSNSRSETGTGWEVVTP